MTDQASDTNTEPEAGQAPPSAPPQAPGAPAGNSDVDSLLAKIADLESIVGKTRSEAAQRRVEKQKALKENSEYKALSALQEAELEELRAWRAEKAAELEEGNAAKQRLMAIDEQREAKLTAEIETLADHEKLALSLIPDLDGKMTALAAIKAAAPAPEQGAPEIPRATPASGEGEPDFSTLKGAELNKAAAAHPKLFSKFMRSLKRS